ncbi:translational GTPase TypA [Candidatus Saccharibacteria bacterium]|nr:translational GTPase TypA [Candidatus Saccharibacteria bacterium]MBI3338283.1 translational GTPase TypA [Candidatus Saccharibacteria bacterium]
MTQTQDPTKIRNIAIIAHVDHGKTTLVDGLLKQSQTFRDNQAEMSQELIMDSGDQERERGITITAKVTAVQHNDYRINIIDTPGHADFSGEVERTLNMADGCILIVDAQEGPMPQTKFVLSKALASELKPIVIINKIDKSAARIKEVEDELADLFLELAVHEDQLHYPVYYAVGRSGKAWVTPPVNPDEDANLEVIFDAIISHIPAPQIESNKPFQMLVTALAWDSFRGKYAIGRITRGQVKPGDQVTLCKKDNTMVKVRVDNVYMSHGLSKFEVPGGVAGDIVQLTGITEAQIGDTVADATSPEALPVLEVEAPTLKIYLGPNTSPFKGTEGEFTTSRQISERLQKELETNVGLRVEEDGIGFLVSGRGELHLSVLIETMRREGFEFEVGRPQVVTHQENGITMEPLEELIIEVPAEHVGTVQMELGMRRATLKEQFASPKGVTKLVYELPTRALLGLRNILLTNTKGTIIMNSLAIGSHPLAPPLGQLRNGVLIAFETGITTPYSLQTAEDRGNVFVGPAIKVYAGQIIGLNKRQEDMEINVCKAKHLTNMRSSSSDGVVQLTPPTIFSLEECLDFIENDELLEVTPKSLRLRKKELDPNKRKRVK